MALSSTLFACRHSRPMASLSSDLVQRSPWSAGHRATPCPGCPGQDWWDFGDDQHLKMIMMSTITLEHWCPGLDWWDFGDNNYDISEWSGPWWSPWRMIRTIMIILENAHGHDCHLGELSMTCLWFRTPWCHRGRRVELGAQSLWSRFSNCEYCENIL